MKKLLITLICCVCALLSVNASMYNVKAETVNDAVLNYTFINQGDSFVIGGANTVITPNAPCYVINGTTSQGSVKVRIPAYYDDGVNGNHPVSAIANNAFYLSQAQITELDISNAENLEYIGSFAFADCYSLSGSILFNEKLTFIGRSAFKGCNISLLSFSNNLEIIEENAFALCSNLSCDITIPDSTITIGESAFKQTKIKKLVIGTASSLRSIGQSAFQDSDLSGTIYLPSRLKQIGNQAFDNTAINLITFAATSTPCTIGYGVFPETVTEIQITNRDAYLVYLGLTEWAQYRPLIKYVQPTLYTVSVNKNDKGTVTVTPSSAVEGSKIDILIKPLNGCSLKSLKINGEEKTATLQANGYAYSFVLTGNTNVEVIFDGQPIDESTSSPSTPTEGGGCGCKSSLYSIALTSFGFFAVSVIIKKRFIH